MIQLRSDCLVVQTSTGDLLPCAADDIMVELVGAAATFLDPELVRQAARAILHYFKHEQGRDQVSVGEFSAALGRVLRSFGLRLEPDPESPGVPHLAESDLRRLACEAGKGFELVFFARLREEVRRQLREAPRVVRFNGLRSCVKQLLGARRWNPRCQQLNDQIVDFLRGCLQTAPPPRRCAMVVQ
jgi:hypothetical protein